MKASLCNADIDRIVEMLGAFLTDFSTEKRNLLRNRLLLEEALLRYQEHFGEQVEVDLSQERHLRQDILVLRIPGESFDPFSCTEQQTVMHHMLTAAGIGPVWSYKHGCNRIVIAPGQKRKISNVAWIIISVIAGFALGFLSWLLPEQLTNTVTVDVLAPLSDTMMSLLSSVSIFLIFFSVITGVCGMGDISTFQRIGRKMLRSFMLMTMIYGLIAYAFLLPFFPISAQGAASFDGKALYSMLLDIIPDSVTDPFTTGNTMQVIILAIIIGITMLAMRIRLTGVLELFMELNELVQRIMEFIISFLPIVVFISIFQIVALRQLSTISTVYRYPLLCLLCTIVFFLLTLLYTGVKMKVSPFILAKKLLPTYIIAVTTASSAAAYTCNVETCENRLGIRKELVDVGVPLGQVLYMPGSIAVFFTVALCLADIYGTPITVSKLVMLFLISIVLCVAMPPIPGSSLPCYVLVLAQLGIPVEAVAIAVALDVLTDRMDTPANLLLMQLKLIHIADSLGMLDKEILRKNEA